MVKQESRFAALILGLTLVTATSALASGTPYRVHGPIEDFLSANDRLGDEDLFWQFLDDQRGENLLQPDTITDLERIRANADSYKGVPLLFVGRFHRVGSLFNPFYTHFTSGEFVNFSIWGQHTQLWTQEGVLNDYPYCYIRNTHSMIDRFLSLERLDTVLFIGRSQSSLKGQPWLEIEGMWKLDDKITTDDTRAIRRGEDSIAMGDWPAAAAVFSGLADRGLADVYGTYVEQRAAESLLMCGDFWAALRYAKRARSSAPSSESISKLYDRVKMAVDTGGCPGCPPARQGIRPRTGGQVPWQGSASGDGGSGSEATGTDPGSWAPEPVEPVAEPAIYTPPDPPDDSYFPPPQATPTAATQAPAGRTHVPPPSARATYVPLPQPVATKPPAAAHSTPGNPRPMATTSAPRVAVPPPPPAPGVVPPSTQPTKPTGDQEILDRPGRGY